MLVPYLTWWDGAFASVVQSTAYQYSPQIVLGSFHPKMAQLLMRVTTLILDPLCYFKSRTRFYNIISPGSVDSETQQSIEMLKLF